MKKYLKITATSFIMFLFLQCKQAYDPQLAEKNLNILIVEGFINSGQGPTVIHISRSVDLKDTSGIKPEAGAQVSVEDENGLRFQLTENSIGEYITPQLSLNNNLKYRLRIETMDGKDYTSDFSSVKHTPAIDSITWIRDDGVRLYVNTHDAQNATKYYQWKYEETWEFHSAFFSSLKYIRDASSRVLALEYRFPDHRVDTSIYKCWKTLNSTTIILGSSESLTTDRIYLPVHYIEPASVKLSVLYSLKLKQYALSHDAYLFMQKMKRNTEQLGSLFDPQPSEISGNIHCVTNPNELVIGFVEVSEEQTRRIFIDNNQLPGWNYNPGCFQIEIDNQLDSIEKYGVNLEPTLPTKFGPFFSILAFNATTNVCMDCTMRGTNQKPSFWP